MLNLVKNRAGCCRWMYNGTFNAAVRGISTVNRRKMVLFTETPAAKGLLSKVSSSSTVVSRAFSSGTMKIATYEEVKDLCNHPEKLLIDVREPHELLETGSIPTSINIPLLKTTRDPGQNGARRKVSQLLSKRLSWHSHSWCKRLLNNKKISLKFQSFLPNWILF
ncbi:uncharacterized protein LOC129801718 isoform X4 [Phlebotomus papatasi]|uniref:uncharacterized protein LOC129801718 isoform X4 n=1 Tax=Phlebotomus papatasi TaxID=29031 RepID=UPI00248457F6|nr:uncharacterized protein LOC129801718 isoform X4 [Phlebotomus papatasi]